MTGTYQLTPLEVAKSLLEAMDTPDLQAVLSNDEVKDRITPQD